MNDDKIEKNDVTEELNNRLNNIEQTEESVQHENTSEIYNHETTNYDNASAGGNSLENSSTESVPAENDSGDTRDNLNGKASNVINADTEHSDTMETKGAENADSQANPNNEHHNFEALPDQGVQNRINETQKIWQMNNPQGFSNTQNFNAPNYNAPNYNNYYKENYKKSQKKSDAWKYILVSVVSSILGGAILATMLLVVAPAIQPELKSFFGGNPPDGKQNTQTPAGELKRVEIVQTAESAVTSVAEKVGPSVVGIRTTYQNTNDLFGVQSEGGEGSGIIISSDGYILTNHHVIENAVNDRTRKVQAGAKIEVFLPNKIDKPYVAEVKGYDSKTDLAVLKITENNLNAIEFGNSDTLKIGEPAIAIGNPGGLEYMGSVTQGVISGLNRTVQLDGGRKIKLVQTDAAINPGNSGGALVNLKGQLIGVNTVKMVATGFEGLGFAIPVNDAKRISDELIKNTYISKPYLGISVDQRYTEDVAKENKMPMGVYVADVEILGAAEKAGIQAGDVITKFSGKSVKSYAELEDEKNKHKPGDTVQVEIYRDGKTKTVQVKLGETK